MCRSARHNVLITPYPQRPRLIPAKDPHSGLCCSMAMPDIWSKLWRKAGSAPGTRTEPAEILPKTGQRVSYYTYDDGALRAGLLWPSPRFTDVNHTLRDNLTGLVWARDAGVPKVGHSRGRGYTNGAMSWHDAREYVDALNHHHYLGSDDWRVPNIRELSTLIHWGESEPWKWLLTQGFSLAQPRAYWSSSAFASPNQCGAWWVDFQSGNVEAWGTGDLSLVLPVRGRADAAAPLRMPRFLDNRDGTVTDNSTRLVWSKSANLGDPMSWDEANKFLATMTDGSSALRWRLPNIVELLSLVDYEAFDPALPKESLFVDVRNDIYWSSTTDAGDVYKARGVVIPTGKVVSLNKRRYPDTLRRVWPVRQPL